MSDTPVILIADDQANIRESLKNLLSVKNYKIYTGRDGREAIELLGSMDVDIAILDIVMPRMDGFQVMEYIKDHDLNTAVIAITGDASVESSVKALKKGAYDYLAKPYEPEKLLKTIDNALDYKKSEMELKKSREALQESEQKYKNIINNMMDGYYRSDMEGNLIMASPSSARIMGYDSPKELLGNNLAEKFYAQPEDRENFLKELKNKNKVRNYEVRLKRKDGKQIVVESNSQYVFDKKGKPVAIDGVFRDITNRRQLETRLQVAQKMEAIATLAGGMAHQFNNALSPIGLNIDMLEMDYPGDKEIADYTGQMRESVKRMTLLSNQLLAYARGGKYEERVLSLSELLSNALPLVRHTVDPSIRIDTDLPDDICYVKVDVTQIQMVLSAILANASDAIEDEGCIWISCGNNTIIDENITGFSHFNPGDYTRLMIEDNGKGMDEETRNRIFEPFFTTKEAGKGTGLGLSTVYGIVKQNNGLIDVASEPGKGTAFDVYIPCHVEKLSETPHNIADRQTLRGDATILLVEDEPTILTLTTRMLKQMGYAVVAANTPGEAIRLSREHAGDIHLLVTDVVMPEMNGRNLAKNIMSFRPNIKCLFMSGYTADVIAHHGVVDEGVNFISKPFRFADLSAKVSEALMSE